MTIEKTAHIVSIGLEQRRVSTYIPKIGADKIVIIYFKIDEKQTSNNSIYGFKSSLLARLEENRKKFKIKMENELGLKVTEVPLSSFEINDICFKIYEVIEDLKAEGYQTIYLNLSTGHTLFKIAAYILTCYDPMVKASYGFVHDYLADKINTVLEKNKEWILSNEDQLPKDLKQDLKELYNFVQEGHTGITTDVLTIPKIPMPKLEDPEKWILDLVSEHGEIPGIFIAEEIISKRPKCLRHHLNENGKEKAKALTRPLGNRELSSLINKGYLEKINKGNRVLYRLTDAGNTVIDFCKGIKPIKSFEKKKK